MKKYYLTLTLSVLMFNLFSQTAKKAEEKKVTFADFAYANPERDTLFLTKDSPMARNTYLAWQMDPKWNGINPVIEFVPQEFIDSRKSLDLMTKNSKAKN